MTLPAWKPVLGAACSLLAPDIYSSSQAASRHRTPSWGCLLQLPARVGLIPLLLLAALRGKEGGLGYRCPPDVLTSL